MKYKNRKSQASGVADLYVSLVGAAV